MLNQNQSKRINRFKFLIVLPFLVLFLASFNTKEVVKFSTQSGVVNSMDTERPTFKSPLNQRDILRISSAFGPTKSPFSNQMENHTGIDIVTKSGKDVLASAQGTVAVSDKNTTNGNYLVIEHSDGYSTRYLHLKDRSVEKGDKVEAGKTIGHVGNTGKSTGTHLHFEILKYGEALNPESLVPFKTNQTSINSEIRGAKKSTNTDGKFEMVIDKDTSDEQLLKLKSDLANDKIDFSYTTVRNDNGEIISLELEIVNGNNSSASYASSNSEDTIEPTYIFIDTHSNTISVGKSKNSKLSSSQGTRVWISKDDEDHKEIRVKKINGKKIVIVDGEEVNKEDLDNMEIHMDDSSGVFIHTDSDNEHNVKVISKKGNGLFFMDSDGVKNPLYIINGEESSSLEIKRLSPDDIKRMDVLKGEAALKKYGKKAKDGVIEITTKEN